LRKENSKFIGLVILKQNNINQHRVDFFYYPLCTIIYIIASWKFNVFGHLEDKVKSWQKNN
jgi:hypothetical protein